MSSLRILLVDDHEVVRLGLRSLLDRHPGFDVVGEASAEAEAVQKALELLPDLVLMDIRLAGGSGVDACQQIMLLLPETKVIMLTSYAEDEMLLLQFGRALPGYVLKQVGSNDLIRAIEAASRGKRRLIPP
ncbi:MAG: response regulator transcription factor [Chloroflexi bacterium]|nr:response regulator transcription factor [Chloroflexota bacterium]